MRLTCDIKSKKQSTFSISILQALVECDQRKISYSLRHLVSHAIGCSSKGGSVTIRVKLTENIKSYLTNQEEKEEEDSKNSRSYSDIQSPYISIRHHHPELLLNGTTNSNQSTSVIKVIQSDGIINNNINILDDGINNIDNMPEMRSRAASENPSPLNSNKYDGNRNINSYTSNSMKRKLSSIPAFRNIKLSKSNKSRNRNENVNEIKPNYIVIEVKDSGVGVAEVRTRLLNDEYILYTKTVINNLYLILLLTLPCDLNKIVKFIYHRRI